MIVELYPATTKKFNATLKAEIRDALIPSVFINRDLWQSRVSGEKYIGVRVFFIDRNMILRTHLLGEAFQARPVSRQGEVVMEWLRQVLAQHGAQEKNIAGAVTDAGSDISTGMGRHFKCEWCFPHMLNRVTTDGTGMANSRGASKNTDGRDRFYMCKKVVEYFNRSTSSQIQLENEVEILSGRKESKAELSQAIAQRWISTCTMLLHLLQKL